MLHLPITSGQRAELFHVLRGGNGHVTARGRAEILTSDHRAVSNLSGWLVDGQVEIDTTADVTRTATCTILDPDARAGLDSAKVTDTSVRIDRFLRLRRDYWLPSAQEWVSVPLFTGPISGVERSGDTITVAAQGKESLALGPVWTPLSWGKTTRRVQVIEDLMAKGAGEWAFSLPPGWRQQLGKTKNVPRVIGDEQFTPWKQATWMASSMSAQLFYDARGELRLRKRPVQSAWTFTASEIAGRVQVQERTKDIINQVIVTGGIPKGGKKPITWSEPLPDYHPWSPWALGRRGVPRRLIEEIEDETLVTRKAAVAAAKRRLREHATTTADITFDALPMPLLEPHDLYRVDAGDVAQSSRLTRATVPVHGDLMSVGAVRVYRPARRRSRR